MRVLAIDPGREKCGLAVVENAPGGPEVLWQGIVPRRELEDSLAQQRARWQPQAIVLGHATSSQPVQKVLSMHSGSVPFHIVRETNSTLEARELYWETHPPTGWRRWVPLSLQVPPVALDDFAAIILARRFFAEMARNL